MVRPSKNNIQRRLEQIDPYQLEKLVAEIWEKQGYQTNVRNSSADRGIDVEATKEKPFNQRILIQVKRYKGENNIGSEEVRKYSTLKNQGSNSDMIVLVTTSDFTAPAEELAADLNVKIIDGDELSELVCDYFNEIKDKFPEICSEIKQDASKVHNSESEEKATHPFDVMTPNMTKPTKEHRHFKTCSVCNEYDSIWYTKGGNSGKLLKCGSCGTIWRKTGLLFKTWEMKKEGRK